MTRANRNVRPTGPLAIALVALALAAPYAFAQADLAVTVENQTCDPCTAGQRATIVNTVTNLGPSPDPAVELQIVTPALGTTPVEGSWATTQGEFETDEESGAQVFFDPSVLMYFFFVHVGPMVPNQTVTVNYDVDLDPEAPPAPVVRVDSPADIAGELGNSVATWAATAPFIDWAVNNVKIQPVEDGSGNFQACGNVRNFEAGNIAYIDRGSCEFGAKALGAEVAGAVAVIIANNAAGAGVIPMGPGEFGDAVTVPVVMISFEDGERIKQQIVTFGNEVRGSFTTAPSAGPGESWEVTSEGSGYPSIWAYNTTSDPDCPTNANCPPDGVDETDNIQYLHFMVNPGSGPIAPVAAFSFAPAAPMAGDTVTFTDMSTNVPTSWAWDFGGQGTSTVQNPTFVFANAGTYTVSLTATNAAGSNTVTHDVVVTPAGAGPVAAFSFAPASPRVNDTVTFTDLSTGAPTTWAWDFGGMGTSTEQNPTFVFTTAGTYTVTLTVTNADGTDSESHDVTVQPLAALDEFYFIAAAANAAGAAGSFFQTDAEINNAGDAAAQYQFLWLPRNTDNSNPTASDTFTLAAGASVRYENVLHAVFGADEVVGALAVVADSTDLIIMSRTYNQTENGTFGQSITGLHSSRLIQANDRVRVVFMSENEDYRSNLGLLNGTGAALTVHVALYNAAGEMQGEMITVELDPWENTQINRVFQDFLPVNGYVDLWTETAGGAFVAYGSVLDNVSSDPTTVMPE